MYTCPLIRPLPPFLRVLTVVTFLSCCERIRVMASRLTRKLSRVSHASHAKTIKDLTVSFGTGAFARRQDWRQTSCTTGPPCTQEGRPCHWGVCMFAATSGTGDGTHRPCNGLATFQRSVIHGSGWSIFWLMCAVHQKCFQTWKTYQRNFVTGQEPKQDVSHAP